MQVFITGATGYLAGPVIRDIQHQNDVTGLTRTEEGAASLEALGVRPVVGTVQDPDAWREAAEQADAIIHMAMDPESPAAGDEAALDGLLDAARAGKARTFIYTSGCWVLGDTGDHVVDEHAGLDHPAEVATYRPAHERRALDAASEDLATAVIRPVIVYGGRKGLVSSFFRTAEEAGAAAYVGTGENRWSLVHREDVARLYHRVMNSGARGVFHAAEGTVMRVRDIAEACSRAAGYGGTTRAIPLEQARETMGPVADALALDQRVAARRSAEIGWKPRHTGFGDSVERVYREWLGG